MTWLPLYSMGATHQNMKASLMRVKPGERLSWSRNNSDRKTMVSTSQYLSRAPLLLDPGPSVLEFWRAW